MFTGIVRTLGRVVSIDGGRLVIRAKLGRVPKGASVAVNGVCLTVVSNRKDQLAFDVSPETFRLTNLGGLRAGDRLNVEPSLRAADFIGGHWVSGHVDERAAILKITPMKDGCACMRISFPAKLRPFVVLKGSITVDGTSLTVTAAAPKYFETVLVPHTLKATTLGEKRAGDAVNLEADMMARYLHNLLKHSSLLK